MLYVYYTFTYITYVITRQRLWSQLRHAWKHNWGEHLLRHLCCGLAKFSKVQCCVNVVQGN